MTDLIHYIEIIILGIIEGVTEFLPISSTGHLLIAEGLGLGHEPDVFNVVIQSGAILAVVIIYWSKIVALLGHLYNKESRDFVFKILVAFLITATLSYIAIKKGFHLPETLTPIAWATLIGGIVILIVEFCIKGGKTHHHITWLEAILFGVAQVVAAIFPGTSRSGATIMTGLSFGLKRPAATEFSFLLGIPTMFLASGYELFKNRQQLADGGGQLLIDIALGFLVSLVVAFFVVKWLLHYVQGHTFNGFAIYRIILGLLLLLCVWFNFLPELGAEPTKTQVSAAVAPAPEPAPPVVTPPAVVQTNPPPVAPALAPVVPASEPDSKDMIHRPSN